MTVTQLQHQIASVEGFRVSFDRLGAAETDLEDYAFDVMAPSKWKVSDWKRMRLGAYLLAFKNVHVYRGDDTVVKSDIQLVNLRDSYYEARFGTLEPVTPENVIPITRIVGRTPPESRPSSPRAKSKGSRKRRP